MANDLTTLNVKLATQLRDTAYAVWATGEMNDLLTWAVARLYPHIAQPMDPTATTVTLVDATYYYALPTGTADVTRVDHVDAGSNERGPLVDGAWEIVGDAANGTGKLHVAPRSVTIGGTLRLHGYRKYDLTANYVPDQLVPLVLAIARAEAYRRMGASREQFTTWQARNQVQNVSVNELLLLTHEAEAEEERLWRRYPTRRRPVPGRI